MPAQSTSASHMDMMSRDPQDDMAGVSVLSGGLSTSASLHSQSADSDAFYDAETHVDDERDGVRLDHKNADHSHQFELAKTPLAQAATSQPKPNAEQTPERTVKRTGTTERRLSQSFHAAIPSITSNAPTPADPLSQHIFTRTNTETSNKPGRWRASNPVKVEDRPGSPKVAGHTKQRSSLDLFSSKPATTTDAVKDKKGFLSRLSMRPGKKPKDDENHDSESEYGGSRTDGTNASVFTGAFSGDGGGFVPTHKEPPRYIKVRAQFKKEPEFERMFLAQELVGTAPNEKDDTNDNAGDKVTIGVAGNGGRRSVRTGGAIWATEFSKDGRCLAAAGKDGVIRIWTVISTPEERQKQEDLSASTSPAGERLSAPVFVEKPVLELTGHTSEVLSLSWSKNNFLLSTSMDKTVKLWHVSGPECLCTFKHRDLVTKVSFHPKDDRFFLAGCLDMTLRLWSIPDKAVAYSVKVPDLTTAVAFTPDGKTAIAGLLNGLCLFFDTEGLKQTMQVYAKSSRGKNSKGSKITGIATAVVPDAKSKESPAKGTVEVMISTNDSRIRVFGLKDGRMNVKFKGHENLSSQIAATFSDDAAYVITGSEDRKAFVWNMPDLSDPDAVDKEKLPVESFNAHGSMVTTAIFAPTAARKLLGRSGDPIYDLCNPPPVTLKSLNEAFGTSTVSNSVAPSEAGLWRAEHKRGETLATPSSGRFDHHEEYSPAYLARESHTAGMIIVTSDIHGVIKVFRQDCAWAKRRHDNWETGSGLSRRLGDSGLLERAGSFATRSSISSISRSRRGSLMQSKPSSDYGSPRSGLDNINSWRNAVVKRPSSCVGSATSTTRSERSVSPGKGVRTPASGMGLAAETRRQQYANASPSVRSITSQPAASVDGPTSPTGSGPIFGLGLNLRDSLSMTRAKEKEKDKDTKAEKQAKTKTKESDPAVPPVPSFSFKAADEDGDSPLRLDPAGASYGFWNLNRWKPLATLRASMGGPAEAAVIAEALEEPRDADATAQDRASERRKSLQAATSSQRSSQDDEIFSSRGRRSVPPGGFPHGASRLSTVTTAATRPSIEDDHALLSPTDGSSFLRTNSVVSKLSSELTSEEEDDGEEEETRIPCTKCGGKDFHVKRVQGRMAVVCGRCGTIVDQA